MTKVCQKNAESTSNLQQLGECKDTKNTFIALDRNLRERRECQKTRRVLREIAVFIRVGSENSRKHNDQSSELNSSSKTDHVLSRKEPRKKLIYRTNLFQYLQKLDIRK